MLVTVINVSLKGSNNIRLSSLFCYVRSRSGWEFGKDKMDLNQPILGFITWWYTRFEEQNNAFVIIYSTFKYNTNH